MLALKHSMGLESNSIKKAFHFDRNSVCALQAVEVASNMVYKSPYSKSFSIWAKNDMVPNKGEFFKYSTVAIGYGANRSVDGMNYEGKYIWILYEVVAWNASFNNTNMDTSWHHYCLTMSDRGLPKVYIDGVLKLTGKQLNINTQAQYCQYTLGNGGVSSTSRAFAGYLTRFCIFNKTLTDAEVAVDFALGITTPPTNSATQTFLDMTVKDGVIKDKIGTYDMNIIGEATQVNLSNTM